MAEPEAAARFIIDLQSEMHCKSELLEQILYTVLIKYILYIGDDYWSAQYYKYYAWNTYTRSQIDLRISELRIHKRPFFIAQQSRQSGNPGNLAIWQSWQSGNPNPGNPTIDASSSA